MTVHDAAPGRALRRSPTPHEDALVQRIRAAAGRPAGAPSEEHRAATRARLVAMAAVRPLAAAPALPAAARPPGAPRLPRLLGGGALRRRSRVTAGLAGAALTVGARGGVLAASRDATPGDLLHPVKRGGEQTQLAPAGDGSRGRTLLEFAGTRLTELTALTGAAQPARTGGSVVAAAGPDAHAVVDLLATVDRQTTRGAREVAERSVASGAPAPLADLVTWAAGQQAGLATLSGAVPEPAGRALAGSTELATAVADRARALVTALACTTGPATVGVDDLGPRPAPCPPEAGRSATREAADPGADAAAATGAVPTESADPTGAEPAGASPTPTPTPAPRAPAPAPAPERPDTPPVVDVPLPLCVTALGLPVLC